MNDGIVLENFIGGVNESVDNFLLKTNECINCQNFSISDGALATASGCEVIFPSVNYPNLKSIMPYYNKAVGSLLVAYDDKVTHIKSDTDKTNIITSSTSSIFDSINFNVESKDVIILTNGSDHPYIFDGTTAFKMKNRRRTYNDDGSLKGFIDANGKFCATINDVNTYAPKGKYVELHYERLWIAGNPEAPSTVYFSTADVNGFDPQDFTIPVDEEEVNMHGGEIDIYTNDGGIIQALRVVFDDILIFKTKNIFKIFGNNPSNYTKIQIFSSNGAIADKTICSANDGAYFINREAIYKYDGTNVAPISQKISKTFKKINKNYIQNSVAIFHNNKYILAVPLEDSTTNNLVIEYDVITRSFTYRRGMDIADFCEYNGEILYINSTGKIYKYNVGASYNGANINCLYETGNMSLGVLNSVKDIEAFYFIGSGNGNIKITCITDRKVKEKIVTLSPEEKVYKVRLKNRGRFFRYKIENIDNSNFKIKSPKIILEMDVD